MVFHKTDGNILITVSCTDSNFKMSKHSSNQWRIQGNTYVNL